MEKLGFLCQLGYLSVRAVDLPHKWKPLCHRKMDSEDLQQLIETMLLEISLVTSLFWKLLFCFLRLLEFQVSCAEVEFVITVLEVYL